MFVSRTFPSSLPSVLRLLMMSRSVVLPAPLGPMRAHMSPACIVPVTCAAWTWLSVRMADREQEHCCIHQNTTAASHWEDQKNTHLGEQYGTRGHAVSADVPRVRRYAQRPRDSCDIDAAPVVPVGYDHPEVVQRYLHAHALLSDLELEVCSGGTSGRRVQVLDVQVQGRLAAVRLYL